MKKLILLTALIACLLIAAQSWEWRQPGLYQSQQCLDMCIYKKIFCVAKCESLGKDSATCENMCGEQYEACLRNCM